MKTVSRFILSGAAAGMLFCCSCSVLPPPLKETNPEPLPEPLPEYSGVLLYSEKELPLQIVMTGGASVEDQQLRDEIKDVLRNYPVKFSAPGTPFDVQIVVRSDFRQLTPEPQCRLENSMLLSMRSAKGDLLMQEWKCKNSTLKGYAAADQAKMAMKPVISETLKRWGKEKFSPDSDELLKVSVVRYRMTKHLLETGIVLFDNEVSDVLNKLRRLDGVCEVRLIESDRRNRFASFRVLYRKKMFPRGIAAEVK